MIRLITFGHPIQDKNGALLLLWMITVDSYHTAIWLNVNLPGLTSSLYKHLS
jgi:hypothetical protein